MYTFIPINYYYFNYLNILLKTITIQYYIKKKKDYYYYIFWCVTVCNILVPTVYMYEYKYIYICTIEQYIYI